MMPPRRNPPNAEHVLVLAPTGRDAVLAKKVLAGNNIDARVCKNIEELASEIDAEAGAAIVAEEALAGGGLDQLAACLARQEPWSDFPIVLLTALAPAPRKMREVRTLGNVSWVERPTKAETLAAAVESALRGRRRQYAAFAARKRDEIELRRAAELQQRLIGISGHDLRNPLSAIMMAAALLAEGRLDEKKRARLVERIDSSARRMERIVADLTDYSRSSVGTEMPLFPRPCDFHRICNDVLDEIRATHPTRAITYDAEGDPMGTWDPDRLKQVLSNLLTNAIKYGSASEAISLHWSRGDDGDLVVEVKNAGEPIPPTLLNEIFEPFRLGQEINGYRRTSLGLGLFITREIVRAHRGEVSVTSSGESGTVFTFRLPG